MSRAWLNIDLVSGKPHLNYKGNKRYLNPIGAITSIIASIIILANAIVCLIIFFKGDDVRVITSKEYADFEPQMNISNKIFYYILSTEDGKPIDSRLMEVIPMYWEMTTSNNNTQISKYEILNSGPCSMEKNFPDPKYKKLLNFDVSYFTCLSRANGKPINLNFTQSPYFNSYINLYVAKCLKRPENNYNCYDDDVIEEKIKKLNIYLSFSVETVGLDHHNKKSPLYPSYVSKNIPIPVDVKYIRSYEIRQIIYESEEGFIFTKKKTKKDSYIDISTNNNVMYPLTKVFAVPNTYSIFQYTMNQEYAELYQRSYQSFQTLIANIAGISNFILIIMKLITGLLIDKYMYYHLAEDLIPKESSNIVMTTKSNLLQSSSLKIPKESILSKIEKDNSNININCNQNKDVVHYKMTNVAEQYKKDLPIQRIRMNFWETVFYRFFKNNIKGNYLKQCENLVKEGLSIENIMKVSLRANTMLNELAILSANSNGKLIQPKRYSLKDNLKKSLNEI